jgi:hypothetical protein
MLQERERARPLASVVSLWLLVASACGASDKANRACDFEATGRFPLLPDSSGRMHVNRRQIPYTAFSVVCRHIEVAVSSTVPPWGVQRSKSP